MRNGLRALAAVVLAASITACEVSNETDTYEAEEAATPAPATGAEAGAAILTAAFEPGEGATESATVSGDVNVTSAGAAGFRVEVTLEGLPEGQHAWHIHSAPCGTDGPVVAAFTPTPDMDGLSVPLTTDESGRTEGEGTVPSDVLTVDQLRSGQYSLHVHQQEGVDHGPTLACADLTVQDVSATGQPTTDETTPSM